MFCEREMSKLSISNIGFASVCLYFSTLELTKSLFWTRTFPFSDCLSSPAFFAFQKTIFPSLRARVVIFFAFTPSELPLSPGFSRYIMPPQRQKISRLSLAKSQQRGQQRIGDGDAFSSTNAILPLAAVSTATPRRLCGVWEESAFFAHRKQ